MIFSIGYILLFGMIIKIIATRINFDALSLIGLIFLGIFSASILSDTTMAVAPDLRSMALVIILIRAGLSLNIDKLKKIGIQATLLSFVPAIAEMIAVTIVSMLLLKFTVLEGLMLGAILAPVSPAVITPRMINLINKKIGTDKNIPELVLVSASFDDVVIIVLFSAILGVYLQGDVSVMTFVNVPVSILVGGVVGYGVSIAMCKLFKKYSVRDTVKAVIILGFGFMMFGLEGLINEFVPISMLVMIMSIGFGICNNYEVLSVRLQDKFAKVWIVAEILLFVLVGAAVDINYLYHTGLVALVIICVGIACRMIAIVISLKATNKTLQLSNKEILFCCIALIPKATVQAAIGAVPLAYGVHNGEMMLAISVVAIIFTAPIGAMLIDKNVGLLE